MSSPSPTNTTTTTAASTTTTTPITLSYTTHPPPNPTTKTPILFLHGLETSSLEYTFVTPFLKENYTIHLVDLPGHSGSKNIPFTLSNAINGIANIITALTPSKKAHMVGMSLGGFIALRFCQTHPEMVASLFCTGCAPNRGFRKWFMSRPSLLASIQIGVNEVLPISEAMFWRPIGVTPFPELREVMRRNSSHELLVDRYSACNEVKLDDLAVINGVRVAIVAGARRDDVEMTSEAGRALRKGNEECKAFVVREAVHLWDLQFPELFADGVRAWIEGSAMPRDFEVLE